MAAENPNFAERSGKTIRDFGVVGGIIGLIGLAAKSEFAASLLVPGAVLIVTGQGLKMLGKNRREKSR